MQTITDTPAASGSREELTRVVESYIHGLGRRDFSRVPFAPDFTYESPLLMATIGEPRLIGQQAIDYLSGLFPVIRGTQVKQHVVEGEYCATVFDFDTIFGTIPVFDRFRVVDGELKLANPFYDPTPILKAAEQQRRSQLRAVAEAYFDGVSRRDVSAVPWAEQVVLRSPLGRFDGREAVLTAFGSLYPVLGEARVVEHYFSDDLATIAACADVGILDPPCTLRVVDRFTVGPEGQITEQENHYDPRPMLNGT
jgi:hypothetical protein